MITAALISAMILAESSFNPAARSPKGAVGLMQLTPIGVKEVHVQYGLPLNPDLTDPEQNILYGVLLLAHYYNETGSIKQALARYNCGYLYPYPSETLTYVSRVQRERWNMDSTFERIPTDSVYRFGNEINNALQYLEDL